MAESEPSHHLLTPARVVELERLLAQCTSVKKFDDPDQRESGAISLALGDLEDVFRKYLDQSLPRVLAATTCDELEAVLFDIRLDFQEVVWHLWYPKSFRAQLLGEKSRPPAIDTRLRP
jgi:hypothetical protein